MNAALYFASEHIDEHSLRGRTVAVIDVLRAGSTIATALANGAKEVIPVNTVERAVKLSGSLFGDHILRGGERLGKMIEGFDLGNSPFEYSEEVVRGKAIIYSTTNGSRAIEKARYAKEVVVGAFVNMNSLLRFLTDAGDEVVVLCSGNGGKFSMEDSVCGGMLLQKLQERVNEEVRMTDAAKAAIALYGEFGRSIPDMIRVSEHGTYLGSIGFAEDLEFCSSVDRLDILPRLAGNVVRSSPAVSIPAEAARSPER